MGSVCVYKRRVGGRKLGYEDSAIAISISIRPG